MARLYHAKVELVVVTGPPLWGEGADRRERGCVTSTRLGTERVQHGLEAEQRLANLNDGWPTLFSRTFKFDVAASGPWTSRKKRSDL